MMAIINITGVGTSFFATLEVLESGYKQTVRTDHQTSLGSQKTKTQWKFLSFFLIFAFYACLCQVSTKVLYFWWVWQVWKWRVWEWQVYFTVSKLVTLKLFIFQLFTPKIHRLWSCIFGVTSLKMTSLRVTSLLYSIK